MTVKQLERADVHMLQLPPLPERTLIVTTKESSSDTIFVLTGWIPSTEQPFLLNEQIYTVKLPNLVYHLQYSKTTEIASDLHLAVTTDSVTPDTRLFRWPFSNVYAGGNLCWTKQWSTELKDVITTGVFEFLETRNNQDLFGVGRSYNGPHHSYSELLKHLESTQEVIPQDWLIPLNKTVQEFHNAHA